MRSKLSLVGPKIVQMGARFRAAVTAQERLAVTLRFLATGVSYPPAVISFPSLWTTSQIVPKVCQAMVETLEENIQVKKIVYCTEQTVLHIKSVDWNTETKQITNKFYILWTMHCDTYTWEIATSVHLVGLSHLYITNRVLLITEL